jgi:hypothetical protein
MTARTRRWIESDVWSGDLLQQMVRHDRSHGAAVDRLGVELLQAVGFTGESVAYELLSAAAWLHDIGHAGAMVGDHFVHEYRHVRLTHGLLTESILSSRREAFFPADLTPDAAAFGDVVGLLSRNHQKKARLREADYSAAGYTRYDSAKCHDFACGVCEVASREWELSLEGLLRHRFGKMSERGALLPDNDVIFLAAVLRVSDAADIAVHRVRGSDLHGLKHLELSWRRHYASQLHDVLDARGVLTPAARDVLVRLHREPEDVLSAAKALERLRSEGQEAAADSLEGYFAYLAGQSGHARKHAAFRSSRIERVKDGFDVVLRLNRSTKVAEDPSVEIIGALEYVEEEYRECEYLFAEHGTPLRSIRVDGSEKMLKVT